MSLLLALVFIFAIGMVISAVATFATGAFVSGGALTQQRTLEANGESAATLAIDYIRYHNVDTSTSRNCMDPGGTQMYPPITPALAGTMTVFCLDDSQHPKNPFSAQSRWVRFTVCTVDAGSGGPPATCGNVVLSAEVTFDDLPPNVSASTANTCQLPPAPSTGETCGIAMTVDSWDVRTADN